MIAYDLHVEIDKTATEKTIDKFLDIAEKLGYSGIAFVINQMKKQDEKEIVKIIKNAAKSSNLEVYFGVKAKTITGLEKLIKRRREIDLILVEGGNLKMNRKAVETREVDILSVPSKKRYDCGINHITARLARENDVAIELNFGEFLKSENSARIKVLQNHMEIVRIAKKYKAPVILTSGASTPWELKDPFVLLSYAISIGMKIKESKNALGYEPKRIVQKNRERQSDKWIIPGVRVV